MFHRSLVFATIVMLAAGRGVFAQGPGERPVLRVAYFIPTDRKPEPDRVERLQRVLEDVRTFFRKGMQENGYGPLTFDYERDGAGKLVLHEVHARGPMKDYGRNDAGKVAAEVRLALAKKGLKTERETVLIFQLLLDRQGKKSIEVGPYVGGGSAHAGTAWVYDDARLDPRLLASREPGGWYNGPCSLGQFNTHYIGGVAHELGHGLGLPHDREWRTERAKRGLSLMGGGNHTYGQQLRGESAGAHLSAASAAPLALHPLFTGKRTRPTPMPVRLADLKVEQQDDRLLLTGRFLDGPPVVRLVAYNDPRPVPGDYDAVGWVCPVEKDGTFRLEVGEIRPGPLELRLRAYGASGDYKGFAFRYEVAADGKADLVPFRSGVVLVEALAAFRKKDPNRLRGLAKGLPEDSQAWKKIAHLIRLLGPEQPRDPRELPASESGAEVSLLRMEAMTVGWGSPLRNRVLEEGDNGPWLEVGGVFYASGLYAHAPARHVLRLGRTWKQFTSKVGVQDGHGGSVVFVVKGDGKELYRSKTVRGGQAVDVRVDVAGVDRLELLVEDAGDGPGSDWGVWLEPWLRR